MSVNWSQSFVSLDHTSACHGEPLPDRRPGGIIRLSTRTSQTEMNRDLPKRTRSIMLAARTVVCTVLAFSFAVSSISLAGASAGGNLMSCCIGKAAGHCSAGLQTKARVQPKPEPMCGLKPEVAEVIVAEESAPKASHSEATANSITTRISRPCPQECCTSTVFLRKPTRREAPTLLATNRGSLGPTRSLVESSFVLSVESAGVLSQSPPRGPPNFV